MNLPVKLTVVMTHPVQYFAPWFRHIAAHAAEIDLTVLCAIQPTPEQQGVGFGQAFAWDTDITNGYRCCFARPVRTTDDVSSRRFWGLDVAEIGTALEKTSPDVALINGWHSVTLLRALWTCRRRGIPVLYRGDSHLGAMPEGWRGKLWAMRTRMLLKLFSGYLSVGQRARDYLLAHGVPQSQIFTAPHCVDNEFFARTAGSYQIESVRVLAREAFGFTAQHFVVLWVGKLEAVKRPLDAIEAVARLGPHARLLIVGTGELEARARAEAKQRGLHVTWAGFLNQSELGRAYAVADCLVLPSTTETWGLVVNEALATGLPCVVSDQVGCAPDLITEGETGAIFPVGNVSALAAALRGVWQQRQDQYDFATACRVRVARYSFAVATAGLRAACQSVLSPHQPVTVAETAPQAPRIIACCGGMVIVSGLERMTFEVLRVAREQGAAVHCILNTWENQRIMQLVEQINASWSTGYYWYRLDRHTRNPIKLAQIGWDICRTSLGLLCEARRFQPTHVLVPEFASAVRNAPALLWLRRRGVGIVLRVANVPDDGEFYARLWGQWLPRVVSQFVAISQRCEERLQALGISKRQIRVIRNCVAQRSVAADADADVVALVRRQPTLLYVGQLAPFKGVHIVVEATRALRAAGYDLQTVLVGRLPEWPPEFVAYVDRLRDAVDNDNAAPAIHLVGERQNVLEIMRQSYVLGVPSLGEEGLGNVALEARQVGLPVVAFPAGGLRELVEHKVTGYLCDTADLASFVAGVRFFLDNPEARAQASATSIASFTDPECDFTAAQFRKRWWKLWTESRSVKHDL